MSGVTHTAPVRLCGICAERSAAAIDVIDARHVPVCLECRDGVVPEPPPPPATRERLLRFLSLSGPLDIVDLALALGEDDDLGRAKLSAALGRAIKAGLVMYTGRMMDRTYRLTDAGEAWARADRRRAVRGAVNNTRQLEGPRVG